MYSSTFSLTLALDEGWWSAPCTGCLPPVMTWYPLYRRLVRPPVPVWMDAEHTVPTRLRSLDCPARSKSLYRLCYPGPQQSTAVEL